MLQDGQNAAGSAVDAAKGAADKAAEAAKDAAPKRLDADGIGSAISGASSDAQGAADSGGLLTLVCVFAFSALCLSDSFFNTCRAIWSPKAVFPDYGIDM